MLASLILFNIFHFDSPVISVRLIALTANFLTLVISSIILLLSVSSKNTDIKIVKTIFINITEDILPNNKKITKLIPTQYEYHI